MLIIIKMGMYLNGKKYSTESHRVQFLDHYCYKNTYVKILLFPG